MNFKRQPTLIYLKKYFCLYVQPALRDFNLYAIKFNPERDCRFYHPKGSWKKMFVSIVLFLLKESMPNSIVVTLKWWKRISCTVYFGFTKPIKSPSEKKNCLKSYILLHNTSLDERETVQLVRNEGSKWKAITEERTRPQIS